MPSSVWSRALLRCAFALFALPTTVFAVIAIDLVPPTNPVAFGAPLTLVANIFPASATGTVTFYDGVNVLGYGTLNSGQAQLITNALGAGTHKLRVYYPGPSVPAMTSAVVTETVNAKAGGGFYPSAASPFAVGTKPVSTAVAAFVHGDPADMAVVNMGDSTVSVYRGDEVGGFNAVPNSPFAAGSLRRAVAVGDFNEDGNLDMAVAGGGLNSNANVTILLGDGSGGFTAATGSPFAAGGNSPDSVVVADFNLDGKADLAVGTSQGVTVLLGNGDGTFQAPTVYLGGTPGNTFVAAGDFNGDGKTDLAIAYASTGGFVAILNGDGNGAFTAATGSPFALASASTGPNSIVAGDFNGDGKTDLAVTDVAGSTVSVLLGNGASSFTAAAGSPFNTASAPASLATGDFNGDGIPDLAIAESGGVEVVPGRGDGTFSQLSEIPYPAGTTPSSITIADFNGDGIADIVVANSGSNNVTVLLAYPSLAITLSSVTPNPATFGQQITMLANVLPYNVTGSLTFYDGATILGSAPIVSGLAVFNTIALAPGQHSLRASYVGTGAYRGGTSGIVTETVNTVTSAAFNPASSSPVSAGTSPSAVVAGDFNKDGVADLAVTNASDNTVTILLGNGSGGFTASTGSPFPAGTNPLGIAIGDFNEDGKIDLVIADHVTGNNVTVLLGDGAGGFTAATGSPFAATLLPKSLAVADFNGDGIADLVVGGSGARVMLGSGTGSFAVPGFTGPSGGITTSTVAVGDFNGDGTADAISTSPDSASSISLWSGPVVGFSGNQIPGASLGPGLAVGDLNGDGKTDVVFASSADNKVRVFLGDGAGNFAQPSTSGFPAGSQPAAIALGDFNGDQKIDLAVANSGDGTVSIFLGDGAGNFNAMSGGPFQAGGTPVSLAVADFNGDSRMDIAVANSGSNNVTILLGASQAQTITFASLPNVPVTTAPFTLTATATSGMTVSFTSATTSVCTVSGSTVSILISGGCTIVANQSGGGPWLAAPSVTQKFTVLFNDVDSSVPAPQVAAIDLFAQYGITAGCGNNDFCPGENVTRAQMAIFVIRSIFGGNVFPYSTTPHFSDVGTGDFGFQYIQAMYELGITKGCGNSGGVLTYCPNDSVTRIQMAVFIIRARLGSTATFSFPSTAYFTDVQPLSVDPTDVDFGYVQRMKLEGITSGCTATAYCPNDPVTRAQMAVFIMRALFNQELPANTPVITGISPATLTSGTSNTFTITGLNTGFVQGTTTLAPIPGVTIGTITVTSATSLTVQLTAGSGAGTQPYTIEAITGSEEAILPNALSVSSPPI